VVDRPTDRNPLGTTMVYKYKVDHVKNTVTVTRKSRLCLQGGSKKKKWTSLDTIVSTVIAQAFTYGKLDLPKFLCSAI
jgi:hypothetical protein